MLLSDDSRWDVDYLNPEILGRMMMYICGNDYREIENTVLAALGLDQDTRKAMNNEIPLSEETTGVVHRRRKVNKALALELLTGLMLYRFDSPLHVRSWCITNGNGLPRYFAPQGTPDITARYLRSNGTSFSIVSEVSSMRDVDRDFYLEQLESALKHALQIGDEFPDDDIYILVINNGDISNDDDLLTAYTTFLRDQDDLQEGGRFRFVPIHTGDFGLAMVRLYSELKNEFSQFDSQALSHGLDNLHIGLHNLQDDEEWMLKTLVDSVQEALNRQRDWLRPE